MKLSFIDLFLGNGETQVESKSHWNKPLIFTLTKSLTKPAVSYGFGHIYYRNPYWKTSSVSSTILPYNLLIKPHEQTQ